MDVVHGLAVADNVREWLNDDQIEFAAEYSAAERKIGARASNIAKHLGRQSERGTRPPITALVIKLREPAR